MRLWSIHPCYLDAKGLVALWREALLLRAVLKDQTRGYRHHPQAERFRGCLEPTAAINRYLWSVYEESRKRGYHFDPGKLDRKTRCAPILVSDGQIRYEIEHLKDKLKTRDADRYRKIKAVRRAKPHPLFKVVEGGVETWEKTARRQERK